VQDYVVGELARALRTARAHEDPVTRARADDRAGAWTGVLQGMSSGRLRIGSRTPVLGLPVWVTPQVLRGGFATGLAASGGPLQAYERQWADRWGLPHSRSALFAHFLTDAGLAELDRLLTTRTYAVAVAEEAALLTVAWLLRSGDRTAALDLLEELAPFAHRLRFTPRPAAVASLPPDHLFVRSASQVRAQLDARPARPAVEAQRETLAVWNPLADRFLTLWWDTRGESDVVGTSFPAGWTETARSLLQEYEDLARVHTRSARHRDPKGNLWVLVAATRGHLDGWLDDRLTGRLRTAVAAMVAKRGRPGSPALRQLRETQARVAAAPVPRRCRTSSPQGPSPPLRCWPASSPRSPQRRSQHLPRPGPRGADGGQLPRLPTSPVPAPAGPGQAGPVRRAALGGGC